MSSRFSKITKGAKTRVLKSPLRVLCLVATAFAAGLFVGVEISGSSAWAVPDPSLHAAQSAFPKATFEDANTVKEILMIVADDGKDSNDENNDDRTNNEDGNNNAGVNAAAPENALEQATCDHQKAAYRSHCPTWDWLTYYMKPDEENRNAVFIDIGCNKGYSSARIFERWLPSAGVSQRSLGEVHNRHGTPNYCGICTDCHEMHAKIPLKARANLPHVYCVDGSPKTLKRTQDAVKDLLTRRPELQGWHFHNLAFTNHTGKVNFGDCDTMESCGLRKSQYGQQMVEVDAMRLDTFAKQEHFKFIDIVKIDVEGEEPLVIQGMTNLLQDKRIGLVALEVNGQPKGWWKQFPITWMVEFFDKYGYNCYIDADLSKKEGGLLRLTGCTRYKKFFPSMQMGKDPKGYSGLIPQWGNAICGLRGTHAAHALHALAPL